MRSILLFLTLASTCFGQFLSNEPLPERGSPGYGIRDDFVTVAYSSAGGETWSWVNNPTGLTGVLSNGATSGSSGYFIGAGSGANANTPFVHLGNNNANPWAFVTESFSFSLWVKRTGAPTATGSCPNGFSYLLASDSNGAGWSLYTARTNDLRFTCYTNSASSLGVSVITNSVLTLNDWHHIVGTRSAGTVKLYLDGSPVGTNYSAAFSVIAYTTGTSKNCKIGRDSCGSNYYGWPGFIDDVIVWSNAVLTAAEVLELYEKTKPYHN